MCLPFCAENHACRDVARIQSAARHDEGLVAVIACDAHGHGRVGHGMPRGPAVKDSAPKKSPFEIAGTLAAVEFRIRVLVCRNRLEDVVVEESHGGSLHGDGAGVVQRAVVADKVHIARNKNREERPHHHAGSERDAVRKLVLTGRKTRHHQVVIFHRELVRKRSTEHVESERPAERTQQHVMAQVIERGKLLRGIDGCGIRDCRIGRGRFGMCETCKCREEQ